MTPRLVPIVAIVFLGRLVLAPFAGADDAGATSIRAAASREAIRLSQPLPAGPMPAGLKWTGIGLVIGSGLPVLAANFGDCLYSERHCRNQRHVAYAVGGVMAGTGAALLLIANAKRSPALPTIVLNDGRAMVQQRITF